MDNDQIIGAGGKFYVDVRDGTVEHHLSNGEVRTYPPSNGKSVSPMMLELHEARHTAILGATRAGKSVLRSHEASEQRQPKTSGLLASLLSRK